MSLAQNHKIPPFVFITPITSQQGLAHGLPSVSTHGQICIHQDI